MAKPCCVLCGKEVGWMDRLTLSVFDTEQIVCPDCDRRFRAAPKEEKSALRRQILESPHLSQRDAVRDYLDAVEGKSCPACAGPLERRLKNFLIGSDGYGGLSSMGLEQYAVDLFVCPQCGKVELYAAQSSRQEEKQEEEQVTCPTCGTRYSPLINCPHCALHNPRGFSAPPREKKERKPSWER